MSDPLEFLSAPPAAGVEDASQLAETSAVSGVGQAAEPAAGGAGGETVPPPGPDKPPSAAPVTPASPEPGQVPISALLEERDKRQAYERQLQALKAAQSPPPALTPDEWTQVALYAQNLRTSRRFAERTYAPELVATVHDWAVRRCDEDPHFNAQMRSSEDPYEAAIQAYQREQIVSKVTPDRLAAFEAWEQAQAAAGAAPAAAVKPALAAAPPRSLATASGTGAAGAPHVPVGPGEAFRSIIR